LRGAYAPLDLNSSSAQQQNSSAKNSQFPNILNLNEKAMACFLFPKPNKCNLRVRLAAGDYKEIVVSEGDGSIRLPLVQTYTSESNLSEHRSGKGRRKRIDLW
jgi:hypothetical protein